MYLPDHFRVDDLSMLDALAERDPFATLVTVVDGAPFATQLPVLYAREGDRVVLRGHWARPNGQWRGAAGQTALAILHGPHAYVSPTWYADRAKRVPTWNYLAAHLYGAVELHGADAADPDGRDALRAIVEALSRRFEGGREDAWRMAETGEIGERMLAGIVGFTMRVERIELKAKLHDHHPVENRVGVIEGLRRVGGEQARAVADEMQRRLAPRP